MPDCRMLLCYPILLGGRVIYFADRDVLISSSSRQILRCHEKNCADLDRYAVEQWEND